MAISTIHLILVMSSSFQLVRQLQPSLLATRARQPGSIPLRVQSVSSTQTTRIALAQIRIFPSSTRRALTTCSGARWLLPTKAMLRRFSLRTSRCSASTTLAFGHASRISRYLPLCLLVQTADASVLGSGFIRLIAEVSRVRGLFSSILRAPLLRFVLIDYMTGFRCNVTGSTSDVALAKPQVARRCGADPENGKMQASPGNCTYGAKQPFYWFQNQTNNVCIFRIPT